MNPTPFQKKTYWAALTALSFLALGGVIIFVGWAVIRLISFLQPVITPIAIAGILAYLLEPVVCRLIKLKISRSISILLVYTATVAVLVGILIWIVPSAYRQSQAFANNLPKYSNRVQALALRAIDEGKRLSELATLKSLKDTSSPQEQFSTYAAESVQEGINWVQQKLPDIAVSSGAFLQRSFGGFINAFGFLLSLVLVPIFLFFFLMESPSIAHNWSNYVPLHNSPFKIEVVSLIGEINRYLINFFRGQLLVSLIDGALIASALLIMGLDFAVLIGLMVGILGLIPYAGIIISWIPAVLIATAQYGDWTHPLIVTIIFLIANNLDGMFIAPKIVGNSVGLHPLTVIISVLSWSFILGGLLGALLAVPLTATLKVVFTRYFWDRKVS